MAHKDEALLKELMKSFQAEAADHLQLLNQSLLELEREPAQEQQKTLIQDAFRSAHSLKGAARAVSMKPVESLAHAMETLLQLARDDGFSLTPDVCDVFYDTLDVIAQLVDGAQVQTDDLLNRLHVLSGEAAPTEATPARPAPASPAEAPPASTADADAAVSEATGSVDETIRVNVGKLDDLMAQVSELLVARISAEHRLSNAQDVRHHLVSLTKGLREVSALAGRAQNGQGREMMEAIERQMDLVARLNQAFHVLDSGLYQDALRLGVAADGLQEQIRRMRMVPFQTLMLSLERAVRDAARSEGKQVVLRHTGMQVELDKRVLEQLKDPLMHLLRNAVGHGIEAADERASRGKPPEGQVSLAVYQRGSEVRIVVQDDGRGFDMARLRDAAQRHGTATADDAAQNEIIGLAFLPGVSTSASVTALSGRGVGLDVVRRQLEMVQGRIAVDNRPGEGVTFTLTVPTTLAMTRVLIVALADEQYALPLLSVEKIIRAAQTTVIGGRPMIKLDGVTLPLVALSAILGEGEAVANDSPMVVVMGVADQRIGLVIDDVITEQELAVKALQKPLTRIRNVSGTALLGNGDPIIVLNPVDMIRAAEQAAMPIAQFSSSTASDDAEDAVVQVLVVDDSITTRTLEKNILEAAGYVVLTATDGVQAIERLRQAEVDIIVSDIQMPNMDGITLTRTIRESDEFRHLPLILVTSLESREDREQGMRAGADAYIVKRGFDQAELLATIRQLL